MRGKRCRPEDRILDDAASEITFAFSGPTPSYVAQLEAKLGASGRSRGGPVCDERLRPFEGDRLV